MACVNLSQCLQNDEQDMTNVSDFTTILSATRPIPDIVGVRERMRTPVQVIIALTIVLGILGNVCVLVTVIKKLHTPFYYCLASLAVSDTLSLSILPIFPLMETYTVGKSLCDFILMMDRLVFVCSVVHALAITVERYTAICWPFKFQNSFANSKFKISLLLAFIWVTSFAIAAPYITMFRYIVIERNNVTIRTVCLFLGTEPWQSRYDAIFLPIVYAAIVITVIILSALMVRNIRQSESVFSEAENAAATLRRKNKERAVRIIIMITAMLIVLMLPVGFLQLAYLRNIGIQILSETGKLICLWIARICIYLNSACNPLIYSIASPAFRKSFLEIFVCRTKDAASTVKTSNT